MERYIATQFYKADSPESRILRESGMVPSEFVLVADAQATIAALQARVQELEAIKTPDDAFTYCAYCGEKSPVDEHNEDLSAHIKVCPKHPIRDVEAQLTQRTAELEAANIRADKAVQDRADVLNVKSTDGLTSSEWIMRTATAERKVKDLQAELERVSLLSSHNERRFEEVDKKYKELRTLILTLPKVEGEIVAQAGYVKDRKKVYACFGSDADMTAYAALLTHRQGMEG